MFLFLPLKIKIKKLKKEPQWEEEPGSQNHPGGADPTSGSPAQGQTRQTPTLALRPETNQFIIAGFLLTEFFRRHEVPVASPQGPGSGKEKAREAEREARHACSCQQSQSMPGSAGPRALEQSEGRRDRHRPGARQGRGATPRPWGYLVNRPVFFGNTPAETATVRQRISFLLQ